MYCKFRHALQNFDGHIDKKMISDFFSKSSNIEDRITKYIVDGDQV